MNVQYGSRWGYAPGMADFLQCEAGDVGVLLEDEGLEVSVVPTVGVGEGWVVGDHHRAGNGGDSGGC